MAAPSSRDDEDWRCRSPDASSLVAGLFACPGLERMIERRFPTWTTCPCATWPAGSVAAASNIAGRSETGRLHDIFETYDCPQRKTASAAASGIVHVGIVHVMNSSRLANTASEP